MTCGKGNRMSSEEIKELLRLKDWTKTKLAAHLDLGENIVYRWINGDRAPSGPASILMRQWLTEARAAANDQAAPLPAEARVAIGEVIA